MPVSGGVNVVVTYDIASEVAQQLVCWDRANGVPGQSIQFRTDGNLPYFHIPAGTCAGKPPLKLTPDGATIVCASSGVPTQLQPTSADVAGLNPSTCVSINPPTGLAVTGSPTQTAITVHWTAPADYTPTGYRLSYKKNSDSVYTHLEVAPGATSATVSGLTANTQYNFHVQARDGANYLSAATADVNITTAT
jgi:hypothetical protein